MADPNVDDGASAVTPAGTTTPGTETPGTKPEGAPAATTTQPGGQPVGADLEEKSRAERRIAELIRQKKTAEDELVAERARHAEETPETPASPQTPESDDPEVIRKAVSRLKELGFVTKDEVQALQDRQILDKEHDRLEHLYDGSDGRPKYDRREVEQFALASGIYNPEAAYKQKFEKEVTDWAVKEALKRPSAPFSERPRPTAGSGEVITRETLPELMKDRVWYEKNREKVLDLMARGEL